MTGILCEKPSAARNFATALGGKTGTFAGTEYIITASRGHLYGLAMPEKQVNEDKADEYRNWSLSNLPWDLKDFRWMKVKKPDTSETLDNIKSDLSGCDEIVIATDDDPTGEGELLAWEILAALRLARGKKVTRMYFEDETPKSIQKAFKSRVTLPGMNDDPDYRQAFFRERWDFMSMQFTRIATACGNGKDVLRQGRLKSAMVVLVGDQLKAISEYKKIPFYQNRFRDENGIMYTDPDEPQYKKKEDVLEKYKGSDIVVDSKAMKSTPPRKLLDLSTLSSMLAAKGIPAKAVLDTYQKMYEDHYVSYPRTEDKMISPEQFYELLPLIDDIAGVVGVDKTLLTHRTPRRTHVKAGGAHGANRPGTKVPKDLSELTKYGPGAELIYETLAKNYLAMLAEDYEYEQQKGHVKDYPSFTGIANVPKKQGWKLVFSDTDDKDEDESEKGLGTHADPFIFEGFPKKPAAPTMKWLMKQLEKRNVGTGATRTSIYAQVTEAKKGSIPLLKDTKGKITMTEYGDMSYILLPGTHIGDLTLTEHVYEEMKGVKDGTLDPIKCLNEIAGFVKDDIAVMKKNGKDIKKKARDLYECIWDGSKRAFSRKWWKHRFTDEECERLAAGETITFTEKNDDGDDVEVTGALAVQEYKGKHFLGFKYTDFKNLNPEKETVTGVFKGSEIHFKRIWGGHRFTDDEIATLLSGNKISFTVTGKDGNYDVTGHLAEQEYKGHKFYGFLREMPEKEKDPGRCYGTWKKKEISFKKTYSGHTFTDAECEALLAGKEIELHDLTSKSGKKLSVKGKLANQTYNGHKYVGFKAEFI